MAAKFPASLLADRIDHEHDGDKRKQDHIEDDAQERANHRPALAGRLVASNASRISRNTSLVPPRRDGWPGDAVVGRARSARALQVVIAAAAPRVPAVALQVQGWPRLRHAAPVVSPRASRAGIPPCSSRLRPCMPASRPVPRSGRRGARRGAPCLASARKPARRRRVTRPQPRRPRLSENSSCVACCSPLVQRIVRPASRRARSGPAMPHRFTARYALLPRLRERNALRFRELRRISRGLPE